MRIKNLLMSISLFLCFLFIYWLAVLTKPGQVIDLGILYTKVDYSNYIKNFSYFLLTETTEFVVIVTIILIVIVGVAKKKYVDVAYIVTAIIFSNVATQIFKHYILQRPDYAVLYVFKNSYPSGHMTLVTSVMLGFMLIVPVAFKKLFKIFAVVFMVFFGMAVCVAQWHRLSDVVGSILLTTSIFMFVVFVRQLFSKNQYVFLSDFNEKTNFVSLRTQWTFTWILLGLSVFVLAILYFMFYSSLYNLADDPLRFTKLVSTSSFTVLSVLVKLFVVLGVSIFNTNLLLKSVVLK